MKDEINKETGLPNLITISKIPPQIKIDGLKINSNQCQLNSKKVTEKHPEVEYIEGILVIIDKQNCGTALAHAWNRIGDTHFDTTEMNWVGEDFDEVEECKYLPVTSFSLKELNELKFSNKTIEIVKKINAKIKGSEDDDTSFELPLHNEYFSKGIVFFGLDYSNKLPKVSGIPVTIHLQNEGKTILGTFTRSGTKTIVNGKAELKEWYAKYFKQNDKVLVTILSPFEFKLSKLEV